MNPSQDRIVLFRLLGLVYRYSLLLGITGFWIRSQTKKEQHQSSYRDMSGYSEVQYKKLDDDKKMPSNQVVKLLKMAKVEYFLVLLIGMAIGASLNSSANSSISQSLNTGPTKGLISSLQETPIRSTVHMDDSGRPITKQQLLEPFVIPNLVGFSVATFLPGQIMMPPHSHETMHELFYVVQGKGIFQIEGENIELFPGKFLHIAPTEKHGIWVPEAFDGPLRMVVTGVAVDEKKVA